MNTLSWFLYAADVVSGVGAIFMVIAICCLSSQVLWGAVLDGGAHTALQGALKRAFVVGLVCLFVSAATPSKQTLYAIAASELGEEAYKSALGQKAMKALESFIDKQIPKEVK